MCLSGRERASAFGLVFANFLVLGCIGVDSEHPCGQEAEIVNGYCQPKISPCSVDAGRSWPDDAGLPAGMGDSCQNSDDCASKQADYCAYSPAQGGMCTLSDCTTGPESCPPGFRCLDTTALGMVRMCIPEASWTQMMCR